MTTPPSFRKVNPGDFRGPRHQRELADAAAVEGQRIRRDRRSAQQISQLPGVAQVEVYGSQKFAIRVQVDPVAAAARNISLDEIRRVIASTNSNSPVGTLYGPRQNVTLSATAAMRTADEYQQRHRRLSQRRAGAAARSRRRHRRAWKTTGRRPGSTRTAPSCSACSAQPGSNAVAVVDAVRERLPVYQRRSCRRRSISRCSTTARSRCASRSRTCRSRSGSPSRSSCW